MKLIYETNSYFIVFIFYIEFLVFVNNLFVNNFIVNNFIVSI